MAHRISEPKNRRWIAVAILAFGVSLAAGFKLMSGSDHISTMTYVITETGGPESFDPVHADSTHNLPVARMLYATPVEAGSANRLESSILDSFRYDEDSQTIEFKVKERVKFADGQNLTPVDVALSVARLAFFRPEFPVIKEIEGLEQWRKSNDGLNSFPQGIVLEGRTIRIKLLRRVSNPLFRFSLELFGVIPKSCINLDDASIVCDMPPSSGYFEIQDRSENKIIFRRRVDQGSPELASALTGVTFVYASLRSICTTKLDVSTVVAATEGDFLKSGCDKLLSGGQIHWLPSARFEGVMFNPKHHLFNTKERRQFFAERVRVELSALGVGVDVQRGIFSRLLPGYLDSTQFRVAEQDLASSFRGADLLYPRRADFESVTDKAILSAAAGLGMNVSSVDRLTSAETTDGYLSGKFPVVIGASGFWAQDPIGDISMLFTKGLHKKLSFMWEDVGLYERLARLQTAGSLEIKSGLEDLNLHITDQSILAPVLHFRRLFITSPSVKSLKIPHAITSPAPWHLQVVQ